MQGDSLQNKYFYYFIIHMTQKRQKSIKKVNVTELIKRHSGVEIQYKEE